ncbi:hypothetical protein PsorP6_010845 [Peronosclerospora sorghi]|uniref:Uncharacterized protein n=1 Tax=Peronosclerospora sorghi TaxID=230839 RepID=A0ACC0VW27_9STRA|nr:hypothetical protein PsorP6_010845 [Peronosclerospora sorghi]
MEPSSMTANVDRLQNNLQGDPILGVEGEAKHLFVEALRKIAALPLDSISMEIRRLLVVLNHQAIVEDTVQETPLLHVRNIIAALNARDVLLKRKAANAVGSLCISRVAGQHLLQGYGDSQESVSARRCVLCTRVDRRDCGGSHAAKDCSVSAKW